MKLYSSSGSVDKEQNEQNWTRLCRELILTQVNTLNNYHCMHDRTLQPSWLRHERCYTSAAEVKALSDGVGNFVGSRS